MRLNENTAVATNKVLLVPYRKHHVATYHNWMQDPDIQAATASEPLTLEEEYENQVGWRVARDKLTFIVCAPLSDEHHHYYQDHAQTHNHDHDHGHDHDHDHDHNLNRSHDRNHSCENDQNARNGTATINETVRARTADEEGRMRGDVNLFLHLADDDDEDDNDDNESHNMRKDNNHDDNTQDGHGHGHGTTRLVGEIDVMIANTLHRGNGLGRAAVQALLVYLSRHEEEVLAEYQGSLPSTTTTITNITTTDTDIPSTTTVASSSSTQKYRLTALKAKIKHDNTPSISLFSGLGFRQRGNGPDYFGEVTVTTNWADLLQNTRGNEGEGERRWPWAPGYHEMVYE